MGRPWSLTRLTKSFSAEAEYLVSVACRSTSPALGAGVYGTALKRLERFLLESVVLDASCPIRRVAALGALAAAADELRAQAGRTASTRDPRQSVVWAAVHLLFDYDRFLLEADAEGSEEPAVVTRCALVALATVENGAVWLLPGPRGPEVAPVPVVEAHALLALSPEAPTPLVEGWNAAKARLLKVESCPLLYPRGVTPGEGVVLPAPTTGKIGSCKHDLLQVVETACEGVVRLQELECARRERGALEIVVTLRSDNTVLLNGRADWVMRTQHNRTAAARRNKNSLADAIAKFAKGEAVSLTPGQVRRLNMSLRSSPGLSEVQFAVSEPSNEKRRQEIFLQAAERVIRFVLRRERA